MTATLTQYIKNQITGTAIPIRGNDIDTDQIMPARFLKEITFDNMGNYLFQDLRFEENGAQKPHPLNDEKFKGSNIMVVGRNFGCGSSREHAPQAILRYGIDAIIGLSFAEIFAGNCKALGIPTVTVNERDCESLMTLVESYPNTRFMINIESKTIHYNDVNVDFHLPDDKQQSFLNGTWNALNVLKANEALIHKTAKSLPYVTNFE